MVAQPEWQVVNEECLAVLKRLPADCLDSMVTDPPAGIGFMGKEWDDDRGGRVPWISWLEEIMREARRVLKPGAHALVWAIPRTSHWTATALEQAGFEIRDVITHHFGTGFPKSLNVSKAIDQARVEDEEPWRVVCRAVRAALESAATTLNVSPRELTQALAADFQVHPRMIEHWAARDTDSQPCVPTVEQWTRLRDLLPISPDLDAEVARLNERKGERGDAWKTAPVVGEQQGDTPGFVGERFSVVDKSIRESTDAAKQWEGWGTALKPASEHWILCRKPLAGTVAANVQTHGTGALNVDACRIDGRERTDYGLATAERTQGAVYGAPTAPADFDASQGRWPANLILTHSADCGSDEWKGGCAQGCPVWELDNQSGERPGSHDQAPATSDNSLFTGTGKYDGKGRNDSGGASRFFYVAKPSTAEREEGLAHLPKKRGTEITDRAEGSAGIQNARAGAGRTSKGRANHHPTVKAVTLMKYLVKLITPPRGIVLDPFCGSGGTGIAAVTGGWSFLGIEKDPEFTEIARGRIAHWLAKSQPAPVHALPPTAADLVPSHHSVH